MIARFVTGVLFGVVVVGCAPRVNAFAQAETPAPAAAAESNAGATGADTAPATTNAPAPATPAIETTADPNAYRIGPEDVIDFYVRNDRELNRDRVPVRPDGKVSLPLVNDIQAAGLTANELRAQLIQRLSPFFERPEVSVIVREVNSAKVSVQGNVRMSGRYEVKSQATVLDMIAAAQGFNEFADKGGIRVIRTVNGKPESIKFNYGDAVRAREGANFVVQPGDIIIVD